MIHLHELVQYANDYLSVNLFRDYCPNGLQVEGRDSVSYIISGVTASQALIDAAGEHFAAAEKAQRAGDWAAYGRELEALGAVLQQLMEMAGRE